MASQVQAVRVACMGEAHPYFHVRQYSTYNIPTDHEIFAVGETSLLSTLAGCPLQLMKLRPSLVYSGRRQPEVMQGVKPQVKYGHTLEGNYYENPVALALMRGNEDHERNWSEKVGSVLIARTDGQPLHEGHVPIMLSFIDAVKQSLVTGDNSVPLTPEAFQLHFDETLQYLIASNNASHDWQNLPPLTRDTTRSSENNMEVDGDVTA